MLSFKILFFQEAIVNAAAKGATGILSTFLEVGIDPNSRNRDSDTPLIAAAREGQLVEFRMLLDHGAKLELYDNFHWTALTYASFTGNETIVKEILDRNFDPNWLDNDKKTPLMFASQLTRRNVAQMLLDYGADSTLRDVDGWNALFYASIKGSMENIKLLIDNGLDPNSRCNDGVAPVMLAAHEGHLDCMLFLAQLGADLQLCDELGNNVLHYASSNGRSEIVRQLLLTFEMDSNLKNLLGKTALELALEGNHFATADILMEFGANAEGISLKKTNDNNRGGLSEKILRKGGTPETMDLLFSVETRNLDLLKLLLDKIGDENEDVVVECLLKAVENDDIGSTTVILENGCHVNASLATDGQTPLMKAKSREMTKLLLTFEADVHIEDGNERNALFYAIDNGRSEVVEVLVEEMKETGSAQKLVYLFDATATDEADMIDILIKWGSDCNGVDGLTGLTPLMAAAYNGNSNTALCLIEHGADVNQCDFSGQNALMKAAKRDDDEMVRLLIQRGSDVDKIDNEGLTAVYIAINMGNARVVEALAQNGADLNSPTGSDGETALIRASFLGHCDIVKTLIHYGASVDVKVSGWDALCFASYSGQTETVKILIENGAKVEQRDNKGHTPLMMAVFQGHTDVCKILIEHGANVDAEKPDGVRPLLIAIKSNKIQVVQLLLNSNCQVHKCYPLHYAAEFGNVEIGALLMNQSVFVNEQNIYGHSPLMLACRNGHAEFAEFLLEKGADKYQKDNNNQTAMQLAASNGHNHVCQLLIDMGTLRGLKKASKIAKQNGYQETADILRDNKKRIRKRPSCVFSGCNV